MKLNPKDSYILLYILLLGILKADTISSLPSSLLPPQFPQEKPVVSVYPPVGHHLVDSNNGTMITSPLITNVSGRPGF